MITIITKDPDNIKNYLPEKSWLAFLEWKSLVK